MIVEAALQEDVALIGLSILSGAHMTLVPRILDLLAKNEISDIPIMLGGIIPAEDIAALKSMGVRLIYGPGTSTVLIAEEVKEALTAR